jgi:hypothetical protein
MTGSLRGGEAPEAIQPLAGGATGSPRGNRVKAAGLTFALLLTACSSPEATRTRGRPGADVRNWGKPVELHAGAQPYHKTPCVTEPVECNGPPPVFGPTPAPD